MKRNYQKCSESEASTVDISASSNSQATEGSTCSGSLPSPAAHTPSSASPSPCTSNRSAFKPYRRHKAAAASLAPPSPTPAPAPKASTLHRLAKLLLDIPHASGHLAAHMMQLQTQRLAAVTSQCASQGSAPTLDHSPTLSSCLTPPADPSSSPAAPIAGLSLRRLAHLLLDVPPLAGELSTTMAAILAERQAAAPAPAAAAEASLFIDLHAAKRCKVDPQQQQGSLTTARPATPLPHPTLHLCPPAAAGDDSAVPRIPLSAPPHLPSPSTTPATLLRSWAKAYKAAAATSAAAAAAPTPSATSELSVERSHQLKRRRQEQMTKLMWLRLQQQQCQWQAAQQRRPVRA